MSHAFSPAAVLPDPALLCAVGETLAQVLASNRHLARNPTINLHARRRIEAVMAGLIEVLDRIDKDADLQSPRYDGATQKTVHLSARPRVATSPLDGATAR
jgi:hypothetical protein